MVIPTARGRRPDARVRGGRLTTIDGSVRLAAKHGATIACPITTGIFAWIAAHAADEAEHDGRKRITPYWRTLKDRRRTQPQVPRRHPRPQIPPRSRRPRGDPKGQTVPRRRS